MDSKEILDGLSSAQRYLQEQVDLFGNTIYVDEGENGGAARERSGGIAGRTVGWSGLTRRAQRKHLHMPEMPPREYADKICFRNGHS